MIRLPPRSTRTDTLFPYTTLFRSDADRNAQSDVPVGIGPVLHLLRHQVLVRDQMLLAVPCDDGHGAHTDLVDCASAAADHDDIAGLDRSVHQQNDPRSEEHTSELQSLMLISYAVFCLKKNNKKNNKNTHN